MWTLHTCALRTVRGHGYWQAVTHVLCPKIASISVVCTTPSEESSGLVSACLWPSLLVKVVPGLSPLAVLTHHSLSIKYALEVSCKGWHYLHLKKAFSELSVPNISFPGIFALPEVGCKAAPALGEMRPARPALPRAARLQLPLPTTSMTPTPGTSSKQLERKASGDLFCTTLKSSCLVGSNSPKLPIQTLLRKRSLWEVLGNPYTPFAASHPAAGHGEIVTTTAASRLAMGFSGTKMPPKQWMWLFMVLIAHSTWEMSGKEYSELSCACC